MRITPIEIGSIPALLYGEPAGKAFLYVHGKSASKESAAGFASLATARGYQVLSFDLPRHGDRMDDAAPCDARNGARDARAAYDYLAGSYESASLFACSLGAYFSLLAFRDVTFGRCLFLSPLLDMERLIRNMMGWSGVTEDRLRESGEIATDFGETLSWDYYRYATAHPVDRWPSPTSILYGERDDITERPVLDAFAARFRCDVTVMKDGEHYFHTPDQLDYLTRWTTERLRQ